MLVRMSKMSCTSGPEKWRNSGRFLLLGHPAYSLKLRTHFFFLLIFFRGRTALSG